MKNPRILLAFYSRSGGTWAVANQIRESLGCDVEEIVDRIDRRGLSGYVRSAVDATFHRPADLRPLTADPGDYDLVIVGTPVWNASVSAPVRTFLERAGRLHRVAFFLSHGGSGSARVFRQMERLSKTRPIATLAVRESAVRRGRIQDDVEAFVERVLAVVGAKAAGHEPREASVPAT
jgi:flavodoxin